MRFAEQSWSFTGVSASPLHRVLKSSIMVSFEISGGCMKIFTLTLYLPLKTTKLKK